MTNSGRWVPILLGGFCLAQAANQSGPANLKQLSIEELSQIEVTSPSKEPVPAFRVPMAIHVISSEEIRRSGVATIPDALRLAPGVEVARIDQNKWSIGIRGFGSRLSRSVLVLIDGRSVYTTFFAGTYWEVQDTVLDDIDRIEVIRGPGGTIWGPNAVDGVINIITKHTRETQGVLATVAGGNLDQGSIQVRYGGSRGDRLNYRVYVKGFNRGPQFHQDGHNFDDWRGLQTGFKVNWDRSERDQWTFQGDLYRQDAGQRVNVVSYAAPYSNVVERNAQLSGGNLMAKWNRALKSEGSLQMQAYYDRTNRDEANFGETRDTLDVDFLVKTRAGERHQFSWGAGARSSRGAASEVTSGLTFIPLTRTDYLFTGFFQDEIGLVRERLSLTLGSKVLRTNFAKFQAEPSARLLWSPNKRSSLWAAVTHAVRTPSRVERDFYLTGYLGTSEDGTPFFARFNANNDFKTEQMNGFEFGYRQVLHSSLSVDVASFHNRYQDLFSQELTGPVSLEESPAPAHLLLPAQFRNGLYGTTSGYEVAPEWHPTSFWRLRGYYAYLAMDLKKSAGSQDFGSAPGIEGSSPRHQVVVQSPFDLGRRFQADLTYRYVSALPGQGVSSYSTGDARLGWRVNDNFEISVVGRNLLHPWHTEFASDPGPAVGIRRAAFVRMKWTQ